ncbi:MAG: hypothetical protein AAFX78_18830 [Cyanobacteria bacterium J06638_20]
MHNSKIVGASTLIPVAILLGSCGTNSEIRATQKFAADFKTKSSLVFPAIVNDVYETCIRQANYKTVDLPPDAFYATRTEFVSDTCNKLSTKPGSPLQVSREIEKIHKVIAGYVASLGKLAGDDVVNVKPQVDSLVLALGDLNAATGFSVFNEATAQQVQTHAGALADALANAVVGGYRKEQLRDIIILSDPLLSNLVKGLTVGIQVNYLDYLRTESDSLDLYYQYYLGDALAQPVSTQSAVDPLAVASLHGKWADRKSLIRGKAMLANKYTTLLRNLSCTHSGLVDKFEGTAPKAATENIHCALKSKPFPAWELSHGNRPAAQESLEADLEVYRAMLTHLYEEYLRIEMATKSQR